MWSNMSASASEAESSKGVRKTQISEVKIAWTFAMGNLERKEQFTCTALVKTIWTADSIRRLQAQRNTR